VTRCRVFLSRQNASSADWEYMARGDALLQCCSIPPIKARFPSKRNRLRCVRCVDVHCQLTGDMGRVKGSRWDVFLMRLTVSSDSSVSLHRKWSRVYATRRLKMQTFGPVLFILFSLYLGSPWDRTESGVTSLSLEVCWWLKKRWVPMDVFGTG